jgi:transposase-like protein
VEDLLAERGLEVSYERLMRKLLRKQDVAPELVVTDKLRSYGAASETSA